jgi:hypothetical protein
MGSSVPPILWYLLCVAGFAVFPLAMVYTIHRQRMKALEILRSYAEKGSEPPPAVAELLFKQVVEPDQKWKATPRGSLLQTSLGHFFAGCTFAGVAWWRIEVGPPRWAIYIAVCSAVFFGVAALAQFVAALKSPPK